MEPFDIMMAAAPEEIDNLAFVSKAFFEISHREDFWKAKLLRDFSYLYNAEDTKISSKSRNLYRIYRWLSQRQALTKNLIAAEIFTSNLTVTAIEQLCHWFLLHFTASLIKELEDHPEYIDRLIGLKLERIILFAIINDLTISWELLEKLHTEKWFWGLLLTFREKGSDVFNEFIANIIQSGNPTNAEIHQRINKFEKYTQDISRENK